MLLSAILSRRAFRIVYHFRAAAHRNIITEFHSTPNIVSVSYLDVENQLLSMIHFCNSFPYDARARDAVMFAFSCMESTSAGVADGFGSWRCRATSTWPFV